MTAPWSNTEIVDLARQIERAGEAFYEAASTVIEDPRIRDLFARLCNEEEKHAQIFEDLLKGVEYVDGAWREDEAYLGYLRALADNRVFPAPEDARKAVAALPDAAAAVRMALGFEKDSILFFHEMRPLVAEADREILDHLIVEEQRHVRSLHATLDLLEGRAVRGE